MGKKPGGGTGGASSPSLALPWPLPPPSSSSSSSPEGSVRASRNWSAHLSHSRYSSSTTPLARLRSRMLEDCCGVAGGLRVRVCGKAGVTDMRCVWTTQAGCSRQAGRQAGSSRQAGRPPPSPPRPPPSHPLQSLLLRCLLQLDQRDACESAAPQLGPALRVTQHHLEHLRAAEGARVDRNLQHSRQQQGSMSQQAVARAA